MEFEIVGEIRSIGTMASGRGIRILARLNRLFGQGNWRKLEAELHWFEAHGIGKRKMKIRRFLGSS